jgi:hypothetical protein
LNYNIITVVEIENKNLRSLLMATKMCFRVNDEKVFDEEIVSFTYIKGMAFSQKVKNALSFHASIQQQFPTARILEISTKSSSELGVALSAFNLMLDGRPVESVYHSSKVFTDGTCYDFLIDYSPRDAKRFIRENGKGEVGLKCYRYNGEDISLTPRTLLYDYIYIKGLMQVPELSKSLSDYDIFTDIEFNEKKGVNCQARACAIYSYMLRTGTVDKYMASMSDFEKIYSLRG